MALSDKEELRKEIRKEIEKLDNEIPMSNNVDAAIIVAKSNYYIALATLVAAPSQVVVNTYHSDDYDFDDD